MEINSLILSDAALNVIDNGAWVHGLGADGTLSIFAIGQKSEEAQNWLVAKQIAVREANNGEPITAEQNKEIMLAQLGEVLIKDHDGLTDDGKKLKFNREQVAGWVKTRNGKEFANWIAYASSQIDSKAESFVEVAAKNSSPA